MGTVWSLLREVVVMKPFIDIVKEGATFSHYREGHLYYVTDSGFVFAVPVAEVGNGTCCTKEKTMTFLKWVKPQHDAITEEERPL